MGGSDVSLFGISGQFAKDLGEEGDEATIDFILNDLKSTFGSKFYKKSKKNSHTLASYAKIIFLPKFLQKCRKQTACLVGFHWPTKTGPTKC